MQDNFLSRIHPFVKLICFIILVIMTIISKSLYLTLFITVLILVIILKSNNYICNFINNLNTHKLLLIFIFIINLFIFKTFNLLGIFLSLYKYILIICLINAFIINTNFEELNLSIYYIIYVLKYIKVDIVKFSFDLTISFYLVYKFLFSKNLINKIKNNMYKKNCSIIDSFNSRVVYSINETSKLEKSLKTSYYKVNKIKINIQSEIILVTFVVLFIISIIKEVIL